MAKKKQPFGINNIVSWGATVVIFGLLFKIQNWPYGSTFISIGLSAEAFLFFLLGFQREDKEIDWRRAYPELDDDYNGELPTSSSKGLITSGSNYSNVAHLDKMMEDAKIGPDLINSLATGLRSFGDKVNSISRVADAGDATVVFTNKIKEATSSYEQLSNAFEKASANLAGLANSNIDAQAYNEQVSRMAKNVSALNAVYELELQESSNHLKSMNKFYQGLEGTMQNFNDSINDSALFKDEVARLAKNLASLNGVYGNMLSAMNHPRV
jgi:gliding motility-associated protein GldL